MYKVYVLHSDNADKLYIGFTSNIEQRLLSHNFLATKGYTVKYRPWRLIYTEICASKQEAMKREKELKSSRGRAFIRENILKAGFISVS